MSAYPAAEEIVNLATSCKDPEGQDMRLFRDLWKDEELHRARTHENILELFGKFF